MGFKDWLDRKNSILFKIGDIEVFIEEVSPNIFLENTNERAFRVSVRYPRTATGARLGYYEDDVLYLQANTAHEARQKTLNWILQKAQARKRPWEIDQDYLNIRASEVRNWKQLLTMIRELSDKRISNWARLESFGPKELEIIASRASFDIYGFLKDIFSLPIKAQNILKFVIKKLIETNPIPQSLVKLMPFLRRLGRIKSLKQLDYLISQEEEKEKSPKQYHSVWVPKTIEDAHHLMMRMPSDTVQDVVKIANRFGVRQKDLRDHVVSDGELEEYLNLWNLYKWLIQQPDNPGDRFKKSVRRGDKTNLTGRTSWEEIVERATETGIDHPLVSRVMSDKEGLGHVSDETQDMFWDLFINGPPRLSRAFFWMRSLERLVDMIYNQRQYEPDDTIPF